ncbi:MAG: LysR family transcriptional regulator [Pseudomonadota bacterium]
MVQKRSKEPSWDGLQAVLLVARHGTVRAAAAEIGVAHTTLAHRIAVAEQAMGVTAFVKSVRGYKLTDDGARIVAHAERMAEEYNALGYFLDDASHDTSGPVTVSMIASLLTHVAANAVGLLMARHPGITLNFNVGDSFADLDQRESDVVLRLQNAPLPSLFGRRLCQARSTIYASRQFLGELKAGDAPTPVVGWDDASVVAPVFASLGFENVRVVATTADIQSQLAMALAAPVAVELPCYVGDAQPDLVRMAPHQLRDLNALWILTHDSLRKSPRIRAAFEALATAAISRKGLIEGDVA